MGTLPLTIHARMRSCGQGWKVKYPDLGLSPSKHHQTPYVETKSSNLKFLFREGGRGESLIMGRLLFSLLRGRGSLLLRY